MKKAVRPILMLCVLFPAVCGLSLLRPDPSASGGVFPTPYFWAQEGATFSKRKDLVLLVQSVFAKRLRGASPSDIKPLTAHVLKLCDRYRIHPALVLALIEVESQYQVDAISPKGAVGLMQLMPSTGALVARSLGKTIEFEFDLFDPYLNIELGLVYVSQLKARYQGNPFYVLAAYNAGPGTVDEFIEKRTSIYQQRLFRVTYKYYRMVKDNYFLLKAAVETDDQIEKNNKGKDRTRV